MGTAFKRVANRATGNLNAGIDNAVTSVVLQAGQGALFPTFPGNSYLVTCDNERMLVTGLTTDTLTVTRGADGTSAASHSSGAALELRVVATAIQDLNAAVNALETVDAVRQLFIRHYGGASASGSGSALITTAGKVGLFNVLHPIKLKRAVYNVGVAGTSDAVVRIAVYRADGTLITNANGTDAVGTATGVRTVTFTTSVILEPGQYYLFICLSAGTTGPQVTVWTSAGFVIFRAVNATDDRIWEGTVVVTAGAAPSPLGTVTAADDTTTVVELVAEP